MRAVLCSDQAEGRDALRQIVLNTGLECSADDCVPFKKIVPRLVLGNDYRYLLPTAALLISDYQNHLLFFADTPEVLLSDMNGFGHFLDAALLQLIYWGCVSALLGVATALLWVRGTTPLRVRSVALPSSTLSCRR